MNCKPIECVWDLVSDQQSPWKVVRVMNKYDMAIAEPDKHGKFETDRVQALSFEPPYICVVELGRNPAEQLKSRLIAKGFVDIIDYLCDSNNVNAADGLIYVPTTTVAAFELAGATIDDNFTITFNDGQQIRPYDSDGN